MHKLRGVGLCLQQLRVLDKELEFWAGKKAALPGKREQIKIKIRKAEKETNLCCQIDMFVSSFQEN